MPLPGGVHCAARSSRVRLGHHHFIAHIPKLNEEESSNSQRHEFPS